MQSITTTIPSLIFSNRPPDPLPFYFHFREEHASKRWSTRIKQDTLRQIESMHIVVEQGNPVGGNKFQEQAKEPETHLLPLLGIPKTQS